MALCDLHEYAGGGGVRSCACVEASCTISHRSHIMSGVTGKSPGQVAYEACPDQPHKRVSWAHLTDYWREYWTAIAAAVSHVAVAPSEQARADEAETAIAKAGAAS